MGKHLLDLENERKREARAARALAREDAANEAFLATIRQFDWFWHQGGNDMLEVKDLRIKAHASRNHSFMAVARVLAEGKPKVAFYTADSPSEALAGLQAALLQGTAKLHDDRYVVQEDDAPQA